MTWLIPLLLACGPVAEETHPFTSSTPRVSIQNDASELVSVSVVAVEGTVEVRLDDVAAGTSSGWADFDAVDLGGAEIVIHDDGGNGGGIGW